LRSESLMTYEYDDLSMAACCVVVALAGTVRNWNSGTGSSLAQCTCMAPAQNNACVMRMPPYGHMRMRRADRVLGCAAVRRPVLPLAVGLLLPLCARTTVRSRAHGMHAQKGKVRGIHKITMPLAHARLLSERGSRSSTPASPGRSAHAPRLVRRCPPCAYRTSRVHLESVMLLASTHKILSLLLKSTKWRQKFVPTFSAIV
jgi:hypothetical protein